MLKLAKVFGFLLVIIGLGSSLFIFNFLVFISNLSVQLKFILNFIFNYDSLLKVKYLSLIPALLINNTNKNIPQSV